MIEKFGISARSTPTASFQEDLDVRVSAGVGGIGLWEPKLAEMPLPAAVTAFHQSGLRATLCAPASPTILGGGGPEGAATAPERTAAICASLYRFAPFSPVAVVCESGQRGSLGERDARQSIVAALRQIARTAAFASHRPIMIGFEPSATTGENGSVATSLNDGASLIDEVGEENVGLVLDTWQLAKSPSLLDDIRRLSPRIVGVQISDRREQSGGDGDRVLPNDGSLDLAATIRALEETGYAGWYELETWSADGTFGSAEIASVGRQRFCELWAGARARRPASSSHESVE